MQTINNYIYIKSLPQTLKNFYRMKKPIITAALALVVLNGKAQNVGIGTSTPSQKLDVIGNVRSSPLAGIGNRLVMADPSGTLGIASGGLLDSTAWKITGNNGINGGNTTTAGTNFIGTLQSQNLDIRTGGLYRARFSALGEFFVGTLNTVIAGDLMNAVGNVTFPWAVNGYVPAGCNGGGVYGQVQSGNGTLFASVQGEYYGTNASGAGVRGIAGTTTAIGVQGQEPTLAGWAFIGNGDYGAVLPGNYYTVSDQRLKTNITPLANSLSKVLQMKSYSYDVNKEEYPDYIKASRRTIGFLAQELEKVLPEAVVEKSIPSLNNSRTDAGKKTDAMMVKAVSYDSVIPVLVEAIKEQQQQIEVLKARIATLESK